MINSKVKFYFQKSCKYNNSLNCRSYLSKSGWEIVRTSVFERDRYTCQMCGSRLRNLECHEVFSIGIVSQKLKGFMTLCYQCHRGVHIRRSKKVLTRIQYDLVKRNIGRITGWNKKKVLTEILKHQKNNNSIYSRRLILDLRYLRKYILKNIDYNLDSLRKEKLHENERYLV